MTTPLSFSHNSHRRELRSKVYYLCGCVRAAPSLPPAPRNFPTMDALSSDSAASRALRFLNALWSQCDWWFDVKLHHAAPLSFCNCESNYIWMLPPFIFITMMKLTSQKLFGRKSNWIYCNIIHTKKNIKTLLLSLSFILASFPGCI